MKSLNRWIYAIIGVIVLMLAGLVYAWSVMSGVINEDLKLEQAPLSLTFTIVMAMFCIGCLIAGIMAKKVSPKIYVALSGVLFLAGFFIASMTQGTALLYIGFGILGGLASGFAYNAVMSTMSAWFPDKQGLISGILLMGFGLSSFIIGKLFVAVTPVTPEDATAWRTTFRVMAVVIFVIMIVCSFFFVKPGADFVPPTAASKKVVREPALDINASAMVKKASFWLYYIWAILISAAGLALVSQANGIAKQVGTEIPAGTIATVVGLISIFNGIGRVIFGALFDKKGYKLTMILDMLVFVAAGLILILALNTGNFAFIVIGFVVGGFAYGGVTPTNSAIISDFFGRSNYPMNFSLINTNLIIASFASTIAGRLYDASGSYMSTIFMMIGVTVVGFVVFLGIRRPKSK